MGASRQATLPDVPTLAEVGLAGFYGIFAPAGTLKTVLEAFAAALAKVVALANVKERLTAMGLSGGLHNQAQFAERERAFSATWSCIIKASGFQPH
jgi:tripartite-type tricarboxylate transporter receptor subunit TctC